MRYQKRLHCVKHQSSIFRFLGLDVARGWFNQSGNYIVAAASSDVITMTSLAMTSLADAQTSERQTRVRADITDFVPTVFSAFSWEKWANAVSVIAAHRPPREKGVLRG